MRLGTAGAAALMLAASAARAAEAPRQFDLRCTGASEKGRAVRRWVSIDMKADHPDAVRACFRSDAAGRCRRIDLELLSRDGGPDDGSIGGTKDDPDGETYAIFFDRVTGAYSYAYNRTLKAPEIADKGRCTAAAFTPFAGAPSRPGGDAPPPKGLRF